MKKFIIPASLENQFKEFGYYPNNGYFTEDQLFDLVFENGRKKCMPDVIGSWTGLAFEKAGINIDKFAGVIDVLAFPFGGQNDGRDCKGEFFHPGTDFKEWALPYPPVINAHGRDVDGTGASEETVVGETLKRWKDGRGGWARLGIYKDTPYTDEVLDSSANGNLGISSTGLLKKENLDFPGQLDVWVAGEITTLTPSSKILPCNWLTIGANQKSSEEVLQIIESMDEPWRSQLLELIKTAKDEDVEVSGNDNPVNSDESVDDDSEKVDFPEEENDMPLTEEVKLEIQNTVTAAVTAAMAVKPAESSTVPETEPTLNLDDRKKFDINSLLDKEIAAVKTNGQVNKKASQLVDAYIEIGTIAPEDKDDAVMVLSSAMFQDERQKSDGQATQAALNLLKRNPLKAGFSKDSRLHGFGARESESEVNKQDIADMAAAVGITM